MNLELSLNRLENMQFVRRLNELALAYFFKHVLIQESVYASLLIKERMQLHRAVAETLEHNFAGQLDELAAELAMHYDLAGEHAKAIAFYITAGERASGISAYPEAIRAYERALELTPLDAGVDRANLLVQLGQVHSRYSDLSTAKEKYYNALVIAQDKNQAAIAANALCGLAHLAGREGAHAESQRLAEQGLEWARQAHDPEPTAQALRLLGVIRNRQGNNEMAVQDLQTALGLYNKLQDLPGIAMCLNSLGVVASDRRDWQSAASFFHQALELSQKLGDRYGTGVRLTNLGVVAQEQGDYAAAARYLSKALTIAQEIGDREGVAHVNLNLGGALVKQKDFERAMQHYRAGLKESISLGAFALALYIVAGVAEAQVKMGHLQYGARLLGFAFTHPAATADIKIDFEPVLADLRAALPESELQAEMQRGESLELSDVTRDILSERV